MVAKKLESDSNDIPCKSKEKILSPRSQTTSVKKLKPSKWVLGLNIVWTGIRYVVSTLISLIALFFVVYSILTNQTQFYKEVPGVVQLFIFIICVVLLASVEGLQICIVELKLADGLTFKESHPRAYFIHKLLSKPNRIEQFLVGRQVLVIFFVFFTAQLTNLQLQYWPFTNVEIPTWIRYSLLQTGLFGMLVVVAFGQLMPQLIAAKYPIATLNILGGAVMVISSLVIEFLGLTHFSWVLTYFVEYTVLGANKLIGTLKPKLRSRTIENKESANEPNNADENV